MLVYRAAGEDLELARAELEGFLESQGLKPSVERRGRLMFSDEQPAEGQLRRLALFHEVCELRHRGRAEELEIDAGATFRVKGIDLTEGGDSAKLEEEVGEAIDGEVDLERPDKLFYAYGMEDEIVVAEVVEEIDRGLFEERENEQRPFSAPVSLDPVTARLLVNLSGVPPGEELIDPFCGTGGILIEAGLCGVAVTGVDVDPEMVEGTRKNLEEFGIIVHDIREGDFREELGEENFKALVTDLPYGRASREEGNVREIVEIAGKVAEKSVLVHNESRFAGMEPDHEIYVHSSLTRYVYVQDHS